MIPTIGRIVHYILNDGDVRIIGMRRTKAVGQGEHPGNPVHAGNVFPAIITRVWDEVPTEESIVQLQVFLDGYDQAWASSVHQGMEIGQWFKPPQQGDKAP